MVEALRLLVQGDPFGSADAEAMMLEILAGQANPAQIGAALASFFFRPLDGQTLAGFVRAFRAQAVPVQANGLAQQLLIKKAIDVCGTGGDGLGTFNVSTAVAFAAAASGVPVAKHGNRAVSSRCGSIDVLEALAAPIAKTSSQALQSLEQYHLSFLLAPAFHPAFASLADLRRSLGLRTVLNVLGPLLNPLQVKRQVIGVYSKDLLLPVAEALAELGTTQALIVAGEDGLDEISLSAATRIAHLQQGSIRLDRIEPEQFGLTRQKLEVLRNPTASQSAETILRVLSGQQSPASDMVALNTAAALLIGGLAQDLREGFFLATHTLSSGRAALLLQEML